MSETLTFRKAEETDVPLILTFIRELADYEGLIDEVNADEETLRYNLFERKMAEVLFPVCRRFIRQEIFFPFLYTIPDNI